MNSRSLICAALIVAALPAAAAAYRIRVANEGTIFDSWSLVPGTMLVPAYPEAFAAGRQQVCLTVGYLLNPDGHTSDFALLKSWNSGGRNTPSGFWETFAGNASRALSQWRFQAKAGAPRPPPVYTSVTFAYGPDARTHCAIANLATRIAELRADPRTRRLMTSDLFTRLDIDHEFEDEQRRLRDEGRMNAPPPTAPVLPAPPPPPPPPPPPGGN